MTHLYDSCALGLLFDLGYLHVLDHLRQRRLVRVRETVTARTSRETQNVLICDPAAVGEH
jgi:hypothetical protein